MITQKELEMVLGELITDRDDLQKKIILVEARLEEQKNHLKTLNYVIENLCED